MPKIVVLDGHTLNPGDNPWPKSAAFADLAVYDRTPAEEVIPRAKGAEIVLTNKTPLTKETIDALPELRFISVLATGYNIVDVAAARARGISVSNVPTYGTNAVAQHTWALILELASRVGMHASSVAAGEWSQAKDFCYWMRPITDLQGLTLGIVGRGKIGQRVAEIGRAFGMKVVFGSANHPAGGGDILAIAELFATSDIVSLHCALGPGSQQFVNAALLAKMKPGAFLINTSRGALIHEADLAQALTRGDLAGAALDVLSKEPPPADNPLISAPHCLITPHIAWSTLPARRKLMQVTEENVAAYLAGKPVNVVN